MTTPGQNKDKIMKR